MKNYEVFVNGIFMGQYLAPGKQWAFIKYCHDYGCSEIFFRANFPDAVVEIK